MASPPDPRVPPAWAVARASLDFILDIEAFDREARGADLVDSHIFAAVVAANMAPVTRDPALQRAYGGLDQTAPEDLRRPVTVNAVAQSLRLPFETTRRRIRRMAQAGGLEFTPRGVMVATPALTAAPFEAAMVGRNALLRAFHDRVAAAGALPGNEPQPAPPPPTEPPIRMADRVLWEYVLRITDALNPMAGGVIAATILLALVRGNLEGVADADLAAWGGDPAALARPLGVTRLARTLGLSAETTRRYVLTLEAGGLCRRMPRGLVATAPQARRGELARLIDVNLGYVQRLFARLRQLGVTAWWEAGVPLAARR